MAGITRKLTNKLHDILEYNPATGEFFWKMLPLGGRAKVGDLAGSVYSNGYRYIQIDGLDYRAARLAWFMVHGEDCNVFIDHVNGLRDDNRIDNLRPATNSQNQANRGAPKNNTSGIKGVCFDGARNKWRASITVNGKAKNLGRFNSAQDAQAAYEKAALEAWGDFAKSH
jgi:hypothetical protein